MPFSSSSPIPTSDHHRSFSSSGGGSTPPPNIHGDLGNVRSKHMQRKLAAKAAAAAAPTALTPTPSSSNNAAVPDLPPTLDGIKQAWEQQKAVWQAPAPQSPQLLHPAQGGGGVPSFGQTMKYYVVAGFGMALGMLAVRAVLGF